MRSIPTTHAGTNFRSRLEARWAALFDLLEWKWTYEPMDADGYIPDFLVTVGVCKVLVEVGPCLGYDDYVAKSEKLFAMDTTLPRFVVGVEPEVHFAPDDWYPRMGLSNAKPAMNGGWKQCEGCGKVTWAGMRQPPWKCGDPFCDFGGTHYCQTKGCRGWVAFGAKDNATGFLNSLWREAGNRVQWKP